MKAQEFHVDASWGSLRIAHIDEDIAPHDGCEIKTSPFSQMKRASALGAIQRYGWTDVRVRANHQSLGELKAKLHKTRLVDVPDGTRGGHFVGKFAGDTGP
jgi:hypothetical protein